MASTSAPPFPVPSFQNGEGNTRSLILYLMDLTNNGLRVNGDDTASRIPRDTWITILSNLSDSVLQSFPLPGSVHWESHGDRVVVVEAALIVIDRVVQRENALDAAKNFCLQQFVRLLKLADTFERWKRVLDPQTDTVPTPQVLYEKTVQVAAQLLRTLGSSVVTFSSEQPNWHLLNAILKECLDISQGTCLPVAFCDL
jgi:hypothetical protein